MSAKNKVSSSRWWLIWAAAGAIDKQIPHPIFMTLKREWEAIDASDPQKGPTGVETKIPPGRHEVERIPHPYGFNDSSWLVLKGTRTGASEGSWRQWKNGYLNDAGQPRLGRV